MKSDPTSAACRTSFGWRVGPRSLGRLVHAAPAGLWIPERPIPALFAALPFEAARLLFHDLARGAAFLTGGVDFSNLEALKEFYVGNAKRLGQAGKILFGVLRNRLAEHENHVARYYLERGAWLAALNRAKFAVESYDGAPAVADSLRIMVDCYEALGMTDLAEGSRLVLAESYPEIAVAQAKAEEKPWYRFW